MRLKLLVQYDGRSLKGWQAQAGLPTVEGHLASALAKIVEHEVDLVAAGRTDAGVHAWGQVAHVDVHKDMDLFKYMTGANRFLPKSIRVAGVARVDDDFSARFWAVGRHYVYLLWNQRQMRPDLAGRAGHVSRPLDVPAMQAALATLPVGVATDFSGLRDAECQSKSPICQITHASLTTSTAPESLGLLRLEIGADHFLHHMVRNLMGTLVEVGEGKRPATGPGSLADVLAQGQRHLAGTTFMPDGLYLSRVDYRPHTEHARA